MRTKLGFFLLVACGGAAPDRPPTWNGAPIASLHLAQGESLASAVSFVDPDGDAITSSVTSESGLDVALNSDATSLTVHAPFDAPAQDNVTITLSDPQGESTTYTIAVTIDPLAWKSDLQWSGAAGPIAREHGTLLIDDTARTVMLIGGSGYSPQGTALSDFWKLDLASGTWSTITPTGDPFPPLASSRGVRMAGTTTAYMFGGYTGDGTTDTGDLYRVSYGQGALAFKKLTQVNPPPARELHGFGYDPMSQNFVVFGGYSYATDTVQSDTWIMQLSGDTATWTKLSGGDAPSARYGFFFGTDESAGRFVVFSGAQKATAKDPINAAQDTWALDLRASPPAWSQVLDGTESNHAAGRRNGCFVLDPRGPSMFIFGGTSDGMTTQPGLYALDLRAGHEAWSLVARPTEPVLRSSDFGFYDSVADSVSCGFGNSTMGVYTDLATIGP